MTVSGISDASKLSVGGSDNCAIVTGSVLKCWGYNFYGELGNGTTNSASVPIIVPGLPPVHAVSPGGNFICALLIDGTVDCAGNNQFGQIGNGTFTFGYVPSTAFTPVVGMTDAIAIGPAAAVHTCVLTSSGPTKCWGYNHYGQLGDGTTTDAATPVTVIGL